MRVAIDIRTNHKSGIYRYAMSILKTHSFWSLLNTCKIYFICQDSYFERELEKFLSRSKFLTPEISFHEFSENTGFLRRSFEVRSFLSVQKVDLYYSFHYLPDWRIEVPFIFTIYDLVRIKHASFASYSDNLFLETFGEQEFELMKDDLNEITDFLPIDFKPDNDREIFSKFFYATTLCLAAKSQRIITISEASKKDIVFLLKQCQQRVSVAFGAIDSNIFGTRKIERCLSASLTSNTNYCIFVGLLHERKRFPFLLQALRKVKNFIPEGSKLCVIGNHLDERLDMLEMINYYDVNNFIEIIGEVSDRKLAELYSYASAIVIPSVEEGFCLPALEALVCGCEVIATDLPAIKEVAGNYAYYFPVNDIEALAHLLQKAFIDNLEKKAHKFINHFSWEASAQVLAKSLLDSTVRT